MDYKKLLCVTVIRFHFMRDVMNYHRYDFAEYNRVIIIAVVTINHKLYAMKPNMDNEK